MQVAIARLMATTILIAVAATPAHAQRRPTPTTATKPSATQSEQKKDDSGASTNFTLFAGIATGDAYDVGIAVQGSFRIVPSEWPVAIRIDPYLARHGGGAYSIGSNRVDVSLTMVGVAGNAEYTFENTGSQVEPYVLAGLGMYHSSVSGGGGGSTDLGLDIGGGIRFAKRWAAEAQFKSISGFSSIPIMIGYHF